MILIISTETDGHTQVIKAALDEKGYPYYILDLSLFPSQGELSIGFESKQFTEAFFEIKGQKIKVNECGAVWWRRPQPYTLHSELLGGVERNFTMNECHSAVNGLWLLSDAFWINNPVNDEVAARKVYQLKVASLCGMIIPATMITNSPEEASLFIERFGINNVIYKSFLATEQTWRETRLVKQEEMQNLESVKYAPVIFQECINADIDMRVTIVGDKIFPAAIHSRDSSYKYDFRMNYHECKIVKHELPEALNKQLLKLMKQLGIFYGAVDLRMRPNGEYVFLEVNPAGQWLFMEQPTEMPITQTIIESLISADLDVAPVKDQKRKIGKQNSTALIRF